MPTVHQHAAARRNLVAQFVYLAEEAASTPLNGS